MRLISLVFLFLLVPLPLVGSSGTSLSAPASCRIVEDGWGPKGKTQVRSEKIVSGLEIPWGIAFLPGGDFLVTERPGRIRVVLGGKLISPPVATIEVSKSGEAGMLGIAVDPDFEKNNYFYVYYTLPRNAGNRVQRFTLSRDRRSAAPDQVILDQIPAAATHDGGRIRFGPDGNLYIGTGDARSPDLSQDRNSLAGKILRITRQGTIPSDNPFPKSPVYLLGIRNTQGFDWLSGGWMAVMDHGPSGERLRFGHDELTFARSGANLGWPDLWRCDVRPEFSAPALVWRKAMPPGGALFYSGSAIPEWKGSLLIATLGSRHLQRVIISQSAGNSPKATGHEVYFLEEFGRLREIVQAPDGSVYVTTSNCDGRGTCPTEKDSVIRLRGQ